MPATLTAPAPVGTSTPAAPPVALAVPYYLTMSTPRRFTLAEYHRMIETGILIDGEPYELLEGYLLKKLSRGMPHDTALLVLHTRFMRVLPDGWEVRQQSAVTLSDDSEPEPDFAIVRGNETPFCDHHPGPSEIGLIAEVSASSIRIDQHDKGRIYARDRVPVYRVVNVEDRRIEVYTQPSGPGDTPAYAQRQDFLPDSSVPVVLDGQTVRTITVADVLVGSA